jgi:hypothetical protein
MQGVKFLVATFVVIVFFFLLPHGILLLSLKARKLAQIKSNQKKNSIPTFCDAKYIWSFLGFVSLIHG